MAEPAVVRTKAEMRELAERWRCEGARVGLVPTMGALHEGHLSLVRRARAECDRVAVSIFVNPLQFSASDDLSRYPRQLDRDVSLLAAEGVDVAFAPGADEMYRPDETTRVRVGGLGDRLEGTHRPGHFEGVATVVTKLFDIARPHVAYFGQKDAQQAVVIQQFVRDLNIPVAIEICPTVREPDGLAMSSRNVHLSPADRVRATVLHRALAVVRDAVSTGERDPAAARDLALAELARAEIEPDYLELVSADTMAPLERIDREALAVLAAPVGGTRLIDNEPIHPSSDGESLNAQWRPV
jgi:pantoate--beta-alanine ligase